MKFRLSLLIIILLCTQAVHAVTIVTPINPMISNPAVHYQEDFSAGIGDLYPQHPGNGVWNVQNGKLIVTGAGATPSIIAAPESTNRNYLNRSIHCDITVNQFQQSAMIIFGYRRDQLGNDYFLCAGIYKGRWAIGYYPNEETGDLALLKAFDHGTPEDSQFYWTSLNVEKPTHNGTLLGGSHGYGTVYHIRLDVSGNTVGLFVNNSELPYLKFAYDLIPSGSIGLMAKDCGATNIVFDNFKITDLARSTPDEIVTVPYEQNFNDPEAALETLRFSHRSNWRIEVDGSGNGSLIVQNLPNYKTAIAAFEGLMLNNNFQIDCTITFLAENTVASIFFPLRGLAGYDAGASHIGRMYIRSLSKWPEVSAHTDNNSSWGYLWNSNLHTNVPYNVTLRYENGLIRFFLNGQEVKRWAEPNDMIPSALGGTLRQMVGLGCEYQTGAVNNGVKFDNFRVTNLADDWVPTSADLDLTTPEVRKSTGSITDRLIGHQNSDPLSLYQYLLNNIETLPNWYDGKARRTYDHEIWLLSNAESTLWRKAGTSAGQCFALISFLRSLNIPSRLVVGPVFMRVKDWNRLYNEEIHTWDGLTPVNPEYSLFRYQYWVEAIIEGNRVSLFPWLKFYETVNSPKLRLEDVLWAPSTNFPHRIGIWTDDREEESVCTELIRKMIDPESELFPKDSSTNLVWGTDQPIPILKNYIRDYLESMGSSYSLDQVGTVRKLQPIRIESFTNRPPEILSAQPYLVIKSIGDDPDLSDPPVVSRSKFKLRIEDTTGNGYLEQEFYGYDLLNDRIVLMFIPVESISAGGRATPILRIEGSPGSVWKNTKPTYGTGNKIKITWYFRDKDNVWTALASATCRVGDVVNCFMDTGGVSPEMVDERYKRLLPLVKALGTNSPPSNPSDSNFEPYWGSLLHLLQVKWSGYVYEATAEADRLLSSNSKLYYRPGFTKWKIENQSSSYFMGGMSIDQKAFGVSWEPISLSQDLVLGRTKNNWGGLSSIINSSYEHQVFYDVFGSKTAGSTFKYLRQTQEQGGSVREIKGFSDFDVNRSQIESELAALETHYGTAQNIYSDLESFFEDSPYGYAWLPSISVTNRNLRSVGWLLNPGADTNGVYQGSSKGGSWIHTTFEPSE